MLSLFSVKRPYTIIVLVILVLIIGAVAYLNIGVDLLPEMELPYVVVSTAYVGASPEEVESQVTQPLEAALGMTSGVEKISSVSGENYSMIMLEFAQETNMDSAMVELSSYLDAAGSSFPDGVAAPVMLRINPSMLPVMVMTADCDGVNEADFSDYTKETLLPAFERLEGVASVSAMGLTTSQIELKWNQAAIDTFNSRILAEIDSSLAEAESELKKARRELEDGRAGLAEKTDDVYSDLAEATRELNDAARELAEGEEQMAGAPEQLADKKSQLEASRESLLTLADTIRELDEAEQKLETGMESFSAAQDALSGEFGSIQAAAKALDNSIDQLASDRAALNSTRRALAAGELLSLADLPARLSNLSANMNKAVSLLSRIGKATGADMGGGTGSGTIDPEQIQNVITQSISVLTDPSADPAAQAQALATIDGVLGQLDKAASSLLEGMAEASAGLEDMVSGGREAEAGRAELLAQRTKIETLMLTYGVTDASDISGALQQIDEGIAKIDTAIAELPENERKLAEAREELNKGQLELEKGKLKTVSELTSASLQLTLGETQLAQAEKEFEDQRETAFKNAGLDGVLTADYLGTVLGAEHFSMPAGYLDIDGEKLLVKVGGKLSGLDELSDLTVMTVNIADIGAIKISDVADVEMTTSEGESYARVNGNPGVIIYMQKQSVYSTNDVSERINNCMAELMAEKEGLHLTPLSDQGYYIRIAVDSVRDNLLLGAALAVIVLLLFLRSWRPTLTVALSIPVSLLFAVGLMYFSGVSINVISLAGLAMGVGMLVDNSIVVVENIYRLRALGIPAHEAAVRGAKQMAAAITSSTLTTICVFLPILFTHGLARQLFVDMGLTVAYSLVASLLIALSLTPMLSSRLLIKEPQPSSISRRFNEAFGKALDFSLRHKWIVFVISVGVFVFVCLRVYTMGTLFMPAVDYGQLQISLTANDENATQEEVRDLTDQTLERAAGVEGASMIAAYEGSLISSDSSDTAMTIYLMLDPEAGISGETAKNQLLSLTADLPVTLSVSTAGADISALASSGVSVILRGNDLDILAAEANKIAAVMEEVEGLTEIDNGLGDPEPELRIKVDKNAAMQYNLTVAQVYAAVAERLSSNSEIMTITLDNKDYPVIISRTAASGLDREELLRTKFKVTVTADNGDQEEKTVLLSEIATLEEADGLSSINRINQSRQINITAQVDDEHNIGLVSRELETALTGYQPPHGYTYELSGENESIKDAMSDLLLMIALAIAFIYLIMVAQFQSLLLPFIVLLTIPLAFSGGLLTLIVSGFEISIISMLGFLLLAGIVVNNGIVYIDCVNQLRADGTPRHDALVTAGRMRLRPILMTAMTTICALLGMVFSRQMGSELLQPMALVAMGGLTYATLLTLFFAPALYDVLHRK